MDPWVLIGITSIASGLIALVTAWINRRYRSRDLKRALKKAKPKDKPEIIRAFGEMERNSRPGFPGFRRLVIKRSPSDDRESRSEA
ncbi:hypothetical protein [Nocardia sp. NPDC049149]|uniref:hypothetical protein n=1 Tax=Nocardia sp. NPDC049149 TaxID=3364315 RepID=UPI003718C8EB